MNSRQRHKRRVQIQIRARMDKTALVIEFLKSLPPTIPELYRGAIWRLPARDPHSDYMAVRRALDRAHLMTEADVERYRSTEYGA
jgi:hypothetical protein